MTDPAAYTSPPITAKPNSVDERLAKLEKQVADLTARLASIENGYLRQEITPEQPEPVELVLAPDENAAKSPAE